MTTEIAPVKKKRVVNYVNNKQLYTELVKYKALIQKHEREGLTKPPIPNYIGECLMMIAERLARKPNFFGYSYRDEMISDGIENCITYLNNFNPERTNNPFAYFTQIITYAFIRRIQKEKKQQYIKIKNMSNYFVHEQFDESTGILTNEAENEITAAFVQSFEDGLKKKIPAKKVAKKGLEKFYKE